MTRLLALLLALGALTFGLAACGDDDESSGDSAATSAETTASTTAGDGEDLATPTKANPGVEVAGARDLKKKPKITITAETQADTLITKDLVVGDGKTAKKGDKVTVQYVGVGFNSEAEFDASWDRGEPFEFTIGEGVIDGWSEGVVGMKEGGRRLLVIPGDKAYGEEGSPPAIGANETLAFVVDLEKVG
ncbi:MAG: FKBP-type peptidyl-prolyl cis-trans isomerase [Solirubrobacteraceae bacterium]|nr:FKBP-type peptidyl-prolyl cis-trans isomerase [Solirubrobacteraceae bacterium]